MYVHMSAGFSRFGPFFVMVHSYPQCQKGLSVAHTFWIQSRSISGGSGKLPMNQITTWLTLDFV